MIARQSAPSEVVSDTDTIRRLLGTAKVIAMVGASPHAGRPSHGVMRYLQSAGYRVVPVNPAHAGETLHGETIVGTLAESGRVDLVNVFRRSEAIGHVVDEAIAADAPAI